MKNWIIPVASFSAVLLLLIYCAENDYNFDNPLDKKGTNYLFGDTTKEQEKIGDINNNGISDLFDPTYAITFNANGGTVSRPSDTTRADGRLASLPTPAKSGYTFDGWYTAETSGQRVTTGTNGTEFKGDNTIYARWTDNSVVDNRDGGTTYRTVTINGVTWMAENLNYDVPEVTSDVCYNNSADSCAKYGRLYNWETARTACPVGWHLPSDEEWTALTDFVGSNNGTKLKATSGWYNNGNGTDQYGFSALPGGNGNSDGDFGSAGNGGFWWSATEGDADYAWNRSTGFNSDYVSRDFNDKTFLFSVRCAQD
jgi:uncharacterized protein (TIGR02145 family)/uncharacterized repeat protein (TIGR02543 family)